MSRKSESFHILGRLPHVQRIEQTLILTILYPSEQFITHHEREGISYKRGAKLSQFLFSLSHGDMNCVIFCCLRANGKYISNRRAIVHSVFGAGKAKPDSGRSHRTFENLAWFDDLQKLTNEELMRMYTMFADRRYRFAKNAWYIPIGGDQRCPIMVAKGFRSPDTLDRMVEFQDTARVLEKDFRNFIDAWDFGFITEQDIQDGILKTLEARNIEITERS